MVAKSAFAGTTLFVVMCGLLLAGCAPEVITHTPAPTFSRFLPPTWTPTIPIATETSILPTNTSTPIPESPIRPTTLNPGIFVVYQKGDMVYATDTSTESEIVLGQYPGDGTIIASPAGHMLTYMNQGVLHNRSISSLQDEPLPMPLHDVTQNLWTGGWSPDGKYLAYAIDKVLVDSISPEVDEFPSIYMYSLSENTFSQVTTSNTVETSPIWSPDKQWIAFISDNAKVNSEAQGSFVGATDIFVMSTQCLHQIESCRHSFFRQLTNTGTTGDAIAPAWQPNSSNLGFIYINGQSGDKDIYLVDLHGDVENLTNTPGALEESFSWSADGSKMVFKRYIPGYGTDLYLLNLLDRTTINITYSPTLEEGNPLWSPDGREIAFQQNTSDSNSPIMILSLEENSSRPLANSAQSRLLFWLAVYPEVSNGVEVVISPAGQNLNLRSEPSLESSVLAKLNSGDVIQIVEEPLLTNGDTWWKVKYEDMEGWVAQIYSWYLPATPIP